MNALEMLAYTYDLRDRVEQSREIAAAQKRIDTAETQIAKYKALLAKPVNETYRVYS